jgi:hypothetical protein
VIPADVLTEVRYEDVVEDQEGELRRIVQFLGLEWDPACLEARDRERSIDTPSMWQARQKIYRTSVERWRNYEQWLGEFRELMEG